MDRRQTCPTVPCEVGGEMIFMHIRTGELVLITHADRDVYIVVTEHSVTAVDRLKFHNQFEMIDYL